MIDQIKYVYELIDLYGNVVYVGETKNPKLRLRQHTGRRSSRFYGHQLTLNVVGRYSNKGEAFKVQCELQKEYGLVTDSEKYSNNGKMSTYRGCWKNHQIVTCEKCGLTGPIPNMANSNYHNCK